MSICIQKHCRLSRGPEDGFRILAMRYWPRGVRRDHFDIWHRDLAPSAKLLHWCRAQEKNSAAASAAYAVEWRARYIEEMRAQDELIVELRRRHAEGETLTLLCACHDPLKCHRTVLRDLILEGIDSA